MRHQSKLYLIYLLTFQVTFHIRSHQRFAQSCQGSDASSLYFLSMEKLTKCLLSQFYLYHSIHESDSHSKRGVEYFPSMCFCIWAAFKISFHSSLRNAEMKPAIGNGLTFYCHFSFTNRTHFVLYAQLFFQKRANARASLSRSKKRRVNKELVKLSQRKTLSSLLGN